MFLLEQFGSTPEERVRHACAALIQGKGIILIDDQERENEGDLIYAASNFTTQDVAQMIRDCSGIICLCLTQATADHLGLKPMVPHNTSPYKTAFTISIEASHGVTTGVSAHDRWTTIKAAVNPQAAATDLCKPGHVFPLIARDGGVLERRGHTEGSVDLLVLAGLPPASVLCELMNTDGTMKNLFELKEYAQQYGLTMVSVEDIYSVRKLAIALP